jgi:DNA polymerase III subunit epsilon
MDLATSLRTVLRRRRPWESLEAGPWRAATYSIIDVETTGLDLDRDEIVSVGAAQIMHGRITHDTYYEVARPTQRISEGAACLHALTTDELAAAPPFAEVIPRLREHMSGTVVVAHAAWVERAFLNRALRPFREVVPHRMVDTAALARALEIVQPSGREPSLELLARNLGVPVHTPHHALGDAMTTAEVFLVMATKLEQSQGGLGVEKLLDLSDRFGR